MGNGPLPFKEYHAPYVVLAGLCGSPRSREHDGASTSQARGRRGEVRTSISDLLTILGRMGNAGWRRDG